MNLEDLSLSYTLPSKLMYYPGGKKTKNKQILSVSFLLGSHMEGMGSHL